MNTERIFVFGSNLVGVHGAGAAAVAYRKHGAVWGIAAGHYNNSYAIPTKNERIQTMSLDRIKPFVSQFIAYALDNPHLEFQVTRIGCGLAGYKDSDIAPMFLRSPQNCQFDTAWLPYLGDQFTYWGHVGDLVARTTR